MTCELTAPQALTYRLLCDEWNATPGVIARAVLMGRYRDLARFSNVHPYRAYAAIVRELAGIGGNLVHRKQGKLAALSVKGK